MAESQPFFGVISMRIAISLLLVLMLSSVATAKRPRPAENNEVNQMPKGPPPQFAVASATAQDGKVHLILNTFVNVPRQEIRTMIVQGQQVATTVTVIVPVTMTTTYQVDGKKVQVMDVNGKPMDSKTILKHLQKSSQVLVSNTVPVDPFYLNVIRDDTPIILIASDPVAPAPVPAPNKP
jgi:hypothetical protein